MQLKNIALAGFSFLCLVGAIATTAQGRGGSAPQQPAPCDDWAVVGAGQTGVLHKDDFIYIFDRDYLTLYEVNTGAAATPEKGYPIVRTKLR